ncbi:transcriptional regulator, MarR family [Desulfuromusa kysingii]|uniref:Transcriptional regulator, MarR family n=1 Tax=Desulfuromusa kysingii TaxID=37625 RepID=A0A1H3W6G6_9BACT|nr:MarR family transcriptional regulator [Desulfuromusa kysingii]SDZ82656.1 transcriptional regulator, MarR family [Desulfuromusa kysingii]
MENQVIDNLGYKLRYLARLMMGHLSDQIKSQGVSPGQLPVLCCLNDAEGQTQAELCRHIQVEQPTMANTLRRMERDDLIQRIPCKKDKRQTRIFLTSKIRPTVDLLQQKRDDVLSEMTRLMSSAEVATFHRLLDSAMQALEDNEKA